MGAPAAVLGDKVQATCTIHLVPNPADKALAAPLRAKRDELELELAKLREAKSTMDENAYYTQLEAILLQLAKLYAD